MTMENDLVERLTCERDEALALVNYAEDISKTQEVRIQALEAELARKTEALDKLEAVFQAQQGQAMWAEQDDDGSVAVFYNTPNDERGLISWNFFPSGTVVVSSTKLGTILNLRAARSALEEKTDV